MKRLLNIIFCCICCWSCSQKSKQSIVSNSQPSYDINQYIFPEAKDITETNYVENVIKAIKHYDSEPIYYLRVNKENCLIEIYINDVREVRDYEVSNYVTPIEFGSILKSGTQKVTVKMYPVGDLNSKSFGVKDAPPITKLSEGSQVSVSVVSKDEKSQKGLDDEKLIINQISPKEVAGKEYYEFSFTFDATVPYEFEGWTKGQDLTKLDQKLVQKKALEFYEMIGKIYLNKDLDSRLKIEYPIEKRVQGSFYSNKQTVQETLDEFKQNFGSQNYTMEPIRDYKMVYMGNGKLLRLNQSSLDNLYRGKGALLLKYGSKGKLFPGITLYLPEGRDLATQGFMMWK